MVEKRYEWTDGAKLEEHSKRKHKILREYVFDYLTVRCKLPQQERFRLAIVDGFAGGGRYQCGTSGSPLIFIEELKRATEAVNTNRVVQGLGAIDVECLLVSTAEQNCARRRRQSVPVLLRERGPKAPVSCRAARVEARGA